MSSWGAARLNYPIAGRRLEDKLAPTVISSDDFSTIHCPPPSQAKASKRNSSCAVSQMVMRRPRFVDHYPPNRLLDIFKETPGSIVRDTRAIVLAKPVSMRTTENGHVLLVAVVSTRESPSTGATMLELVPGFMSKYATNRILPDI